MYKIVYEKQTLKDIKKIKSTGLDEKAKALIQVIRQNPFQNPPPYEKLVGNLNRFYSRRINLQDRLVYQVYTDEIRNAQGVIEFDGIIKIIRMWSHYSDLR
jgi:toxin YoeB